MNNINLNEIVSNRIETADEEDQILYDEHDEK